MLGDPLFYANPVHGVEQLGFDQDPINTLTLYVYKAPSTNEYLDASMLRAISQHFGIRIEIHGLLQGNEVGLSCGVLSAFDNGAASAAAL